MKALILAAALSGHYCGTDVPYDVDVQGDTFRIVKAQSVEECSISDEIVSCPQSHSMYAREENGDLVISWAGLKMPIVMPKCE